MIFQPCTHKPRFGDAGIIPGVPKPKFALMLNEGGGNIVWDLISGKPYNFDSTNRPGWGANGALFEANYRHIDGPLLNDIFAANGPGTVLMGYKKTVTPAAYYYAIATWDSYHFFSFLWNSDSVLVYVNAEYTAIATSNFQNNRVVGISWKYDSGTVVRLFGDGVYLGTGTIVAGMPTSAIAINIGSRTDDTDRYAGGEIEWVYFFDTQLSDAEIRYYSMNPYWFLYSKTMLLLSMVEAATSGGTGKTSSDSGSGSDGIAVRVDFILQESPSGSDSVFVKSKLIETDSTSASDVLKNILAKLNVLDAETSIEDLKILNRFNINESGSYNDIINNIRAILKLADVSGGIDGESYRGIVRIGDSGICSEDLKIIARLYLGDDVGSSDLATRGGLAYVALQDSGVGVDSISLRAILGITDSGASVEYDGAKIKLSISESGVGVDDISIMALLALVDSGLSADDITNSGNYLKILSDYGSFIDSIVVVNKQGFVEQIYFKSQITKTKNYTSKITKTASFISQISKSISYTAGLQ